MGRNVSSARPTAIVSLLRASQHIINERTVDVRATRADCIEEGFVVLNEIFVIRQVFGHYLVVADITEHHQPPHYGDSLPACAPSHRPYTDPFCLAIQKSSGSRSIPHAGHSYSVPSVGNWISVGTSFPRQTW